MQRQFMWWAALLLVIHAITSACTPDISYKTALGTITGFGSVFVNGVEYDTDKAKIMIEDQPATLADLKPGMKVIVQGYANDTDGIATRILFEDELEGMIAAKNIDLTSGLGTFNILGQTVTITKETVFVSNLGTVLAASAMEIGMVVEVSGFSAGNSNIIATYLHLKAPDLTSYLQDHPTGMSLKGTISSLDNVAKVFYIGGQAVQYGNARYSLLSETELANDLYVEVQSLLGVVDGQLQASQIELENGGKMGYQGEAEEQVSIEGLVSSVATNSFSIDSQTIMIASDTIFKSVPQAGLNVGVNLKVAGSFDQFGNVRASTVNVDPTPAGRIRGNVTKISRSGTNTGTVTVNGLDYQVNNNTLMLDEGSLANANNTTGSAPPPAFNLQNLSVGNYVEISYYVDTAARRIALSLARDDSSPS